MAVPYTIILMAVLIGFASFAVDWGRVQADKQALETAAMAAARAAAAQLPNGVTAVQNAAVAWAADNTCDGNSVVINATSDVVFGTWNTTNRTFTVLTGSAQSTANAVQINAHRIASRGNAIPLIFATLLGKSTCDLNASAICTYSGSPPNFAGLSSITCGNNATFRSYNSADGSPGGSNLSDNAMVCSNGAISLANATTVDGNIVTGPSGSESNGSGFTITGSKTTQSTAFSYTAAPSSPVGSSGSISLGNNQTLSLPTGTYCYDNITVGSGFTLNCSGPVIVYITGATTINAYDSIPSNLQIYLVGSASMTQTGNGMVCTAVIYGPSASMNIGGGFIMDGSVIVNTLTTGVGAYFNYDTQVVESGSSGGSGTIALVQ